MPLRKTNSFYDGFEHLRLSLSWMPFDIVVMFTAYFDESGLHEGSSASVVAGYISDVRSWQTFKSKWDQLTHREGVKVLHRSEIESFDKSKNFANWDKDHQIKLLQEAHSIIKDCTIVGIGDAVVKSEFDDVVPPVVKRAFGGVYGWLMQDLLKHIAEWAERTKFSGPIRYVFEAGAEGRHQIDRVISVLYDDLPTRNRMRLSGWSYASKDNVTQLQSADWFAYEVYKQVVNQVVCNPWRPKRRSAIDLLRFNLDDIYCWDKRTLKAWVADSRSLIKMLRERERRLRSLGHDELT